MLQMVVPVLRTIRHSDLRFKTKHMMRYPEHDRALCGNEQIGNAAVFDALSHANGMMMLQDLILQGNVEKPK